METICSFFRHLRANVWFLSLTLRTKSTLPKPPTPKVVIVSKSSRLRS
ncbi:hypothetical protein X975_19266, partial [Stegodyphus mimosarum]